MGKSRAYAVFLEIRGKDKFSAQFAKAGRSLRTFGSFIASPLKAIDKLGDGFGSFLEKVPGLAVLGRTAMWVGNELRDLALGASEAGSKFNDLSAQTGIGTRALQEMAYAADQAGVPFDDLRGALLMMTQTLGKGVSRKQLFASLGKDTNHFAKALKEAKTPGEKFELVLSQMAQLKDPLKRAAFATTFFGRAGTKLAGAGAEGAESIRKLRQEAQDLGLVMSEEDIARADEFGDVWGSFGKVLGSLKSDFGGGLIGALLDPMKDLLGYVKENRKEIGATIRELGKKVGGGIVDLAKWLPGAFETVKGVVEWLGGTGLTLVGAGLSLLAGNPWFAAILAAKAAIEWMIENTPKPADQKEKDNALIAAQKKDGTLGGAMAVMGGETQGQTGPLGWAAGLMAAGSFVANEKQWVDEAKDRQRKRNMEESQSFNDAQMATLRMMQGGGTPMDNLAGMSLSLPEQSFAITVDINAPEGVVGKPDVKAPPNTKTSSRQLNKGSRTTLKGGG